METITDNKKLNTAYFILLNRMKNIGCDEYNSSLMLASIKLLEASEAFTAIIECIPMPYTIKQIKELYSQCGYMTDNWSEAKAFGIYKKHVLYLLNNNF